MGKSRFNMLLDDDLKEFALNEAERLGISLGAYINVLIGLEQQKKESLKAMGNINDLVTRIETLNKGD